MKSKKKLSPAPPAPKGEDRGPTYKQVVERVPSLSKAVSKAPRQSIPRLRRG